VRRIEVSTLQIGALAVNFSERCNCRRRP
jgi:hypothetical protein